MASQPYLNLFVRDWIIDTRVLSMEARGAWIDILCYMTQQKEKGVITGVITEFGSLLGQNEDFVRRVLAELEDKNTADIENLPGGKIKITSRRMVRDTKKRATKAEAGRKGMASRYKNGADDITSVITETITDDITKQQQNTGIGIGINSTNERGGTGEKTNPLPDEQYTLQQLLEMKRIIPETRLPLADCLTVYLETDILADSRNAMLIRYQVFTIADDEGNITGFKTDLLRRWLLLFNHIRQKESEKERALYKYAGHFYNWLNTQNLQTEPEKYFDNASKPAATNNRHNGTQGGNGAGLSGKGAGFDTIQSHKRNTSPGDTQQPQFAEAEIVE